MNNQNSAHTFHIPVMGLGFTIDTPVKVAHYGISSVIALLDDSLIEKMRAFYCDKYRFDYTPITKDIEDFRAKRITEYLNIIDRIVDINFQNLINTADVQNSESDKYISLLPESSLLKSEYLRVKSSGNKDVIINWCKNNLTKGSIDVNIMTRVDKDNYKNNEKLPVEFNDAHAALRGFAYSNGESSVVLSSGLNPRLFSYFEKLDAFYPTTDLKLKKKVIIKVSDYRSAFVQGKILANKGIWTSEFRIESGLNCGGHAFATQGHLIGPIMEEFKQNRDELKTTLFELYTKALTTKNIPTPNEPYEIKITAQGGVGTNDEHNFLLQHYKLDSVGWGSPFLLVPEATNVDKHTLQLLSDAKEEDLYLSNISPLGIPFNNLRNNTKDIEKEQKAARGDIGSVCTKKYSTLSKEFSEKGVCLGSKHFQTQKIKELEKLNLPEAEFKIRFNKIIEKACICTGLGATALTVNNIEHRSDEGDAVSICPGPNMAYFSGIQTLQSMIDHIYGKINIIKRNDRPNLFLKELDMYVDYLKEKVKEVDGQFAEKQAEYYHTFKKNLSEGIDYYKNLFNQYAEMFEGSLNDLEMFNKQLIAIEIR